MWRDPVSAEDSQKELCKDGTENKRQSLNFNDFVNTVFFHALDVGGVTKMVSIINQLFGYIFISNR